MQEFRQRYTGAVTLFPGLPEWESGLLSARGVDTPEKAEKFLHPSLADLHDPFAMRDMDRAVELIREAVRNGDRILVYGDYDVDGISAVTILLETLLEEGADASFRIPARHQEGYGLNERAVREAAGTYRLLITVDCGITSVNEVRLAKELGMKVIVTDHHEIPETLPPADAVLNPLLGSYPFRRLCGAGVALKICQALQGLPGVEKKVDAAALATVCDIVPLTDENRVIVREGLRRMPETGRPGLKALMEASGVGKTVRPDDLGFRLGPRLNAAGRLEDADQGVRLLMTRDPEEAGKLAAHLNENNRIRQETERQMVREAMELFPEQADLTRDRVVILKGENWNPGIIGLTAGKLCERLHHPTIVLTRQGENFVGSCRSVPGVNIWEMLNLCGDLFVRFGGHAQAAGLTIREERIPELRTRLNEAVRTRCGDRCFLPVMEYDCEIPLDRIDLKMIDALEDLEPSGFGNPAPVFRVREAFLQEARRVGADGSHLKLTLLEGNALRSGIGFGLGDAADQPLNRVDALFRPVRNEYNGRVTPQLQVQAIRPAETAERNGETPDDRTFFLACLQEMTLLAAKKTEHPRTSGFPRPEHLLKERIRKIDPSRDGMIPVFQALKEFRGSSEEELARAAGVPEEQALFALTVFEQLGFLRWERNPFRAELIRGARPRDLNESPAVRYVRDLMKAE